MTPTSQQLKSRAALLSVGSNTLLVAGKLTVGLVIGSVSVISEAIHSAMDLVAALIALWAVRSAAKPADKEHPFGHGKFENLSGVIEAALIFIAALLIISEALKKFADPEPISHIGLGVGIMAISAAVNWVVSRHLYKVARQTDSLALEADALHLSTDVWTSLGVFIGLGLIGIFNLPLLDPIVAILVAILIIKEAWTMTLKAGSGLVDVELPDEEVQSIIGIIEKRKPPILNFHRLRTRKAGAQRHVDFHLVVDSQMSVGDAHAICDCIEYEIAALYPETKTVIHVENPRYQREQFHSEPIPQFTLNDPDPQYVIQKKSIPPTSSKI